MDNSILIGKVVKHLLESNESLSQIVGNKIFPLVADAKTTYPFIVYSRTNVAVEYTKDGIAENIVDVSVVAVSNKYEESLIVANLIRGVLELSRCNTEDMRISQVHLESIQEEFNEDAYTQRLNFKLKIN